MRLSKRTHPRSRSKLSPARAGLLALVVAVTGGLGVRFLMTSNAAIPNTQAGLAAAIQNVPGATIYRYNTTDSQGTPMLGARVVPSPTGGYVAVYTNTSATVKVASSTDLRNWTFRANLDSPAAFATIASDGGSGFVVAESYSQGTYPNIRIIHYASAAALFGASADRQYIAPRNSTSQCAETFPAIISATSTSAVVVFSYDTDTDCDTFRIAVGNLNSYSSWSSTKNTTFDSAIIASASASGKLVNGSIGYGSVFNFGGTNYSLVASQASEKNNATWSTHLYNHSTNRAQLIPIHTHRGSSSFSLPSATFARGPDGSSGIIVTTMIPSEGAAAGEAGELMYYVPATAPPAPPAAPQPAPTPPPAATSKPSSGGNSSSGSSGGGSSYSATSKPAINANEVDVSASNIGAYQGNSNNSFKLDDTITSRGGSQTGSQKTTASGTSKPKRAVKGASFAGLTLTLGILLVAGGGVYWFMRRREQKDPYGGNYVLPEEEVDVFGSAEELGFGPVLPNTYQAPPSTNRSYRQGYPPAGPPPPAV